MTLLTKVVVFGAMIVAAYVDAQIITIAERWYQFIRTNGGKISSIRLSNYSVVNRYRYGFSFGMYNSKLLPSVAYTRAGTTNLYNDSFYHLMTSTLLRDTHLEDTHTKFIASWNVIEKHFKSCFCNRPRYRACCIPPTGRGYPVECKTAPTMCAEQLISMFQLPVILQLAFTYNWCHEARRQVSYLQKMIDAGRTVHTRLRDRIIASTGKICPNPCLRRPCYKRAGTATGTCNRVAVSLFPNDYSCDCKEGMVWSADQEECLRLNYCHHPTKTPCKREGTEYCEQTLESYKCRCKPGYMGTDCSMLRNACVQRYNTSQPNGYYSCNTMSGNICVPDIGEDNYWCNCTIYWTVHPSFQYSNCLLQVDVCTRRTCVNRGFCTSSPDLTRASCNCEKDVKSIPKYIGESCEVSIPKWSPWTHWSGCQPRCGHQRYRYRKRACQSQVMACYGLSEEIEGCKREICPKLRYSDLDTTALSEPKIIFMAVMVLAIQCGCVVALWNYLQIREHVVIPLYNKMKKLKEERIKKQKKADLSVLAADAVQIN